MSIPTAVPAGPAFGRNVVPGSTKQPHPMMAPRARPQTSTGVITLRSFARFSDICQGLD